MKLSAVLITRNEEANIRECLDTLSFCDERVVIDSGSEDRTVKIATELNALVYFQEFKNFADQKNFAISKAAGEWVLLVDADERVSPDLKEEILKTLAVPEAQGYRLLRKNKIFGRWMQGGENAQDYQLRLLRRSSARFEGLVHERIVEEGIKVKKLKSPLYHYSTANISAYMAKLNQYTALEARLLRWNKSDSVFKKMIAWPVLKAFQRFFLKKGFEDGFEGFVFILLSAYYDFIKWVKCWELEQKKPST